MNTDSLRHDLEFFMERKEVRGNVSVEQTVDRSFADAAARARGPYMPAPGVAK